MVGVLNLVPYFSHQSVRIDISLFLGRESIDDSRCAIVKIVMLIVQWRPWIRECKSPPPSPKVIHLKPHTLGHGFLNSGMHITTGMPTSVYCYMAFIKNWRIKKDKNFKKCKKVAKMQHCWQHFIPHLHCNLVFPLSGFSFK